MQCLVCNQHSSDIEFSRHPKKTLYVHLNRRWGLTGMTDLSRKTTPNIIIIYETTSNIPAPAAAAGPAEATICRNAIIQFLLSCLLECCASSYLHNQAEIKSIKSLCEKIFSTFVCICCAFFYLGFQSIPIRFSTILRLWRHRCEHQSARSIVAGGGGVLC